MIARDLAPRLMEAAQTWPSITLTGPRQSGKTTLRRAMFPQHRYETLEAPDVRAFAAEDPRAFVAQFPQGAILDEVQRAPDLLSYLQGIIDADPAPGRWILTGSQNLSLLESARPNNSARIRFAARSSRPGWSRRSPNIVPTAVNPMGCRSTATGTGWKTAVTDESGTAEFDLHSALLPMTVFVAAKGFAAHLERTWTPVERSLNVELTKLSGGGAIIFPNGVGHVPVLRGRLNPILDNLDRSCIYADNIAINGGLQQPVHFEFGEELRLSDAEGQDALVRIVSIVGRAALVQYRRV